jgi:D-serine deaminase-like pyridoxal phosphate-dependent protein
MHVSEIDTPALVINLDIMERNLARVADYCRSHGLRLRPHTKTHKSPLVGRMQLDRGAAGLTVAKVGEAEVMTATGTADLLLHYPVIGRAKLERLMRVARGTRVTVALDSVYAARLLSEAAGAAQVEVGVLAEADVGLGRVGVTPGTELVELSGAVARMTNLAFEGITFYPGHIKDTAENGSRQLAELGAVILGMVDDLKRAGLAPRIVSGGSTPTLYRSHELAGLTEIRPGTYVYNDLNIVREGGCALEDCAASVLATVVSTARPRQIIIDGGSKTFSSDRSIVAGDNTFGRLVEAPGANFRAMNEEHGYVDIGAAGRTFEVGERVHVIPNHICTCVNMHEQVYGVRGETVECVWKVEARGKLQ